MKYINEDSPCRACFHIALYHTHLWGSCPEDNTSCLEILNKGREPIQFCDCEEYIPGDNLEYLEWNFHKKEVQYETKR